jgi:AcrR family transcriptional regulator
MVPAAVTDDQRSQQAGPLPAARRPGRPRSERADQAIIDAALSLFAENGPEGLCMEKVAARAGVGKATLYRRWHSKEDLLLGAMAVLRRGVASGELRADTDLEAALFMLAGAVLARGRFDAAIPDGYPQRVVDELLAGLRPR